MSPHGVVAHEHRGTRVTSLSPRSAAVTPWVVGQGCVTPGHCPTSPPGAAAPPSLQSPPFPGTPNSQSPHSQEHPKNLRAPPFPEPPFPQEHPKHFRAPPFPGTPQTLQGTPVPTGAPPFPEPPFPQEHPKNFRAPPFPEPPVPTGAPQTLQGTPILPGSPQPPFPRAPGCPAMSPGCHTARAVPWVSILFGTDVPGMSPEGQGRFWDGIHGCHPQPCPLMGVPGLCPLPWCPH